MIYFPYKAGYYMAIVRHTFNISAYSCMTRLDNSLVSISNFKADHLYTS
jgi:hypothetical protein